jgi:catechol 2,3-dioxygenase-like lactoylglutathione lyase family enzyme
MLGDMTVLRMDSVGIVFEDLEAAIAFFTELGLEVEGRTQVEGPWVDHCIGLEGVVADIVMLRTPDGHNKLELSRFHKPAAVTLEPKLAPSNALGLRRLMFLVDDIDDTIARLRPHGAEVVDEVVQFEDFYRLCYLRGPEGVLVAISEQLR